MKPITKVHRIAKLASVKKEWKMTNMSSSQADSPFGADQAPRLNGIEVLFKYNEINFNLALRRENSHCADGSKRRPGAVNNARSLLVTFDALAKGSLVS